MFEMPVWRAEYTQARDATMEIVAVRSGHHNDTALRFEFAREVIFGRLIRMYMRARKINRRQLRDRLEDGSFWEDFLTFLQEIDWDEVIRIVGEIIAMIMSIISSLSRPE